MRFHKIGLLLLAIVCLALGGCGATIPIQRQSVIDYQSPGGEKLHYLLYLPTGYEKPDNAQTRYPMLVVLHGFFENGDNTDDLLQYGPAKHIEGGDSFPFIVLTPQNPSGLWNVTTVNALVHEIIAMYHVDPDRVYLTGVSIGGQATWDAAIADPPLYAAIAPMATYGGIKGAEKIANVKVWAFHGGSDIVASTSNDADAIKAHQNAGGESKLTIYNGVGHEVWEQVFPQSFLYEWLLKQHRPDESDQISETANNH